jgi:DNA replication factor GINS
MNLGDLQSARSKERQKDSLQHLPEDFYADVGAFVNELRTERERAAEAADDPFDAPEVRRLTDDIKTAENTVEAVYERRVGKLVKLASLDAAGMPADEDGLTAEERDLFGTLVDAIESNRAHVLDDVLAGEGDDRTAQDATDAGEASDETDAVAEPANAPEPPGTVDADGTNGRASPSEAEGGVSAADVMGGDAVDANESPDSDAPASEPPNGGPQAGEPTADEPAGADRAPAGTDDAGDETPERDTDRTTVRITRDVGEIFGADERTYHLASEDIVTLPAVNATPLLERDAAEQLD